MLAKALAQSIDCTVRRVQFTPDLLPSDITGVSVFNQDLRDFEFRPGAIFANVVVGDEINRASPKTQSRAAGVHGGGPGHGRRHRPTSCPSRSSSWPPRTRSRWRAPTPCPRRSATGSWRGSRWATPSAARRARHARHPRRRVPARGLQPVTDGATIARLDRRRSARCYASPAIRQYVVDLTHATRSSTRPAARAPPRAPRCTCCAPPGRTPRSPAATTCCPTTCSSSPSRSSRTGSSPRGETQLARRTTADVARRPPPARPGCRLPPAEARVARASGRSLTDARRSLRRRRASCWPRPASCSGSARRHAGSGVLLLVLPIVTGVDRPAARARLRVVRTASPSRVAIDERAMVTVRIRNAGTRRIAARHRRGVASTTLSATGRGSSSPSLRPGRGAGGRVHGALAHCAAVHPHRPARRCVLRDPFGLTPRTPRSSGDAETSSCSPASSRCPAAARSAAASAPRARSRTWSRCTARTTRSMREYRDGDDLRRIHWPATARTGDLMVRQEDRPARRRAMILLDPRAGAHQGHGRRELVRVGGLRAPPRSSPTWPVSATPRTSSAPRRSTTARPR